MIAFDRLTPRDFGLLSTWLAAPHVARWWNHDASPEAVERDFGPTARGEEPAEDLLASENGERPFALVQRARWQDYPEYLEELSPWMRPPSGAVTIDYLIGDEARIGRGRGPVLIAAIAKDTWVAFPDCPAIVVPVAAGNRRSWRALEKAGFGHACDAQLAPDNPIDPTDHRVYRLDRPGAGYSPA